MYRTIIYGVMIGTCIIVGIVLIIVACINEDMRDITYLRVCRMLLLISIISTFCIEEEKRAYWGIVWLTLFIICRIMSKKIRDSKKMNKKIDREQKKYRAKLKKVEELHNQGIRNKVISEQVDLPRDQIDKYIIELEEEKVKDFYNKGLSKQEIREKVHLTDIQLRDCIKKIKINKVKELYNKRWSYEAICEEVHLDKHIVEDEIRRLKICKAIELHQKGISNKVISKEINLDLETVKEQVKLYDDIFRL